jgi:DNA (cytosine-5)-methyltransferase 1
LFCGAGGITAGFEREGFHAVLGADIHRPSLSTYRRNHPHAATILGDIRKVDDAMLATAVGKRRVDVLAAGVPCQGFSLSNRKRWMHDERNFLFREFVRGIEVLKPQAILLENVSGMRSMANGAFVAAIEEAMTEAGSGYQVQHKLLNSADYGVPQLRKRLVFVGVRKGADFQWPAPTHGAPGLPGHVTVREALGDLPSLGADGSSTKYAHKPTGAYQELMRSGQTRLTNHEAPHHPPATVNRIARTKPGNPMYASFRQRIRLHPDRPSPTLVSGGIRPQFAHGHPWDARGMTIRERARIMGFPDTFVFEGGIVMGRVQTGQAVPPPLAAAVARQLLKVLQPKERKTRLADSRAV